MADLASSVISGELYSDTDNIFKGETVPVSGGAVSGIFQVGLTLDALEMVGIAVSGVTDVASVVYEYSENEDMTGASSITIPSVAAPADGEEIFRFVPDHTKPVWARLTVNGGVTGAGTFDAEIASVRK